jgi:hypothetical protein
MSALTTTISAQEANKILSEAEKASRGTFFKSKDLHKASLLYADAGKMFHAGKMFKEACLAYERAGETNEEVQTAFIAARFYDKCVSLSAKESTFFKSEDVERFARRAFTCYAESAKMQCAAESLAKCARILEETNNSRDCDDDLMRASALFEDALDVLCENELELYASDIFRSLCALKLKLELFNESADVCVKFAVAADKIKATATQRRCYLHAIIAHLWAGDAREAEQSYNDFAQIEQFTNSEEALISYELLNAYSDKNDIEIQNIWEKRRVVEIVDTCFARLRLPNPKFDVREMGNRMRQSNKRNQKKTSLIEDFGDDLT